MDSGHFDALTRSLSRGDETRRAVLRLLAGGVLGGVLARLGPAEAETRRRREKRSAAKPPGAVRTEGKKGKGKGQKGKNKPKPRCGPGQKPCADGGCVSQALCCPGQRMCADGACQIGCCEDEWECPGDACIDPLEECCPRQKQCEGKVCIAEDECCPEAVAPLCADECEDIVCQNGELVCELVAGCEPPPPPPPCEDSGPCRPGYVRAPNCACLCPDRSMGTGVFCCPAGTYPLEGEGFRNWCCNDEGCRCPGAGCQCPIGWTPLGEDGALCYPGTPPS